MTLVVVGASGLVGGELVRAARARGQSVVGAARRVAGEATRVVDLADRASIDALLAATSPSVVAICSAWPHVDGCEADPARSLRENVETVENLVQSLQSTRTKVLFFSTDHVFSGEQAVQTEDDAVAPMSVYAKHKRQVEELLLARGDALIVRTAWVFGAELRKKNFLYRVISAARAGETLKLPVGQAGSPTWSRFLADGALDLLGRGLDGVVHLSGNEALTKAEWARLIARELALPPLEVMELPWPDAGQVAPRPARVVLGTTRHALVQPDLRSILHAEAAKFV